MSTQGYYRLPQRRWKRQRLEGYIEVKPDHMEPYEVHDWDGNLLSCWRTMEEAVEALQKL